MLHGPAGPEAEIAGGATTASLRDGLGSVRLRTDEANAAVGTADWDAWGNLRASSGDLGTLGWTGELKDEDTNLVHLRARDYSPGTGRFVQRDTVSPNAPGTQGYNAYQYANGNPTTHTDPSGHSVISAFTNGALLGAAATPIAFGLYFALAANPLTDTAGIAVVIFLLLTLFFASVLLALELALGCQNGLLTIDCGAVFEGRGGADLIGRMFIRGFGVLAAPVEAEIEIGQEFWEAIADHLRRTRTLPEETTTPTALPEETVVPPGPIDPEPTPTSTPNNCDKLNQSPGASPRLLWGNPQHGGIHILMNHGWNTTLSGRARFDHRYSTQSEIQAIYDHAMTVRTDPWAWYGNRSVCRVRVDVGSQFGLVGVSNAGTPTSFVEIRADVKTVLPYVKTMFPY